MCNFTKVSIMVGLHTMVKLATVMLVISTFCVNFRSQSLDQGFMSDPLIFTEDTVYLMQQWTVNSTWEMKMNTIQCLIDNHWAMCPVKPIQLIPTIDYGEITELWNMDNINLLRLLETGKDMLGQDFKIKAPKATVL